MPLIAHFDTSPSITGIFAHIWVSTTIQHILPDCIKPRISILQSMSFRYIAGFHKIFRMATAGGRSTIPQRTSVYAPYGAALASAYPAGYSFFNTVKFQNSPITEFFSGKIDKSKTVH